MNTATVKFTVYGDTHTEIVEKVDEGLTRYLEVDPEELAKVVTSCEIQIEEYEELDAEYSYKATVIARVK